MTAKQIWLASADFERPFGSLSVVRAELVDMLRRGWIRRQGIPREGPGENERLYFLSRRAKAVVPEVAELPARSWIFHPTLAHRMDHTLGVARFLALLHRDVARSGGRARLVDVLRDRELAAQVAAQRYGLGTKQLVPDGTVLLHLDGKPELLFLELMNRGAVIKPGIPATISRSFVAKLWRYKAFLASYASHPTVSQLLHSHRQSMPPGFRVLVVATRGEDHLQHLADAAKDFRTLCYFATLSALEKQTSMLLDSVWLLPTGRRRGIAD